VKVNLRMHVSFTARIILKGTDLIIIIINKFDNKNQKQEIIKRKELIIRKERRSSESF